MRDVYDASRTRVILGPELARGGQGAIFSVRGQPDLLAKVYLAGGPPAAKLAWMKDHPPADPSLSLGHLSIAWPRDLLYDAGGRFVGFLMPRIREAVPLFKVFNPRLRVQVLPGFSWQYLHRTARNLASAMTALHARDYVVGDVNQSNILVTPRALVTLIDTDSFQVRAQTGASATVYPCPVGKSEYTPPELQGQTFQHLIRLPEHDDFALGVLVFQLLMEGNHPFRARWRGAGDPPSLEEKIRAGHFPHQKPPPASVEPPPGVPPLDTLHPAVAFLMRRCFVDGHRHPKQRPSPGEWERALKEAEQALTTCANGHFFSNHLRVCPWCGAGLAGAQTPLPALKSGTAVARPRATAPPRPSPSLSPSQPIPQLHVAATSAAPARTRSWRGPMLGVVALALGLLGATAGGDWATFSIGGSGSSGAVTATAPAGGAAAGDAGIANGCWTTRQRIAGATTDRTSGESTIQQWTAPPAMTIDPAQRYSAMVETSEGVFALELLPEDAPRAVNNFVCLARAGFYDGTRFHRIVPGFVIQGGDPTGTGSGGPGYRFADEPVSRDYERGTLAMANSGPDTNGSQFFIVLDDMSGQLPPRYTIVGRVAKGWDVVDAIASVPTERGPSGEDSSRVEPVTIERVLITEG